MRKIKKVLLVDDDELFNYIHQEILKNLKISETVEIAKNGKEALAMIDAQSKDGFPDLILLDIDMPIMNGFEFLKEFIHRYKEKSPSTKIVMLTSSLNQMDMERANEFNVSGYLNKPLSPEKLQEVLDKINI